MLVLLFLLFQHQDLRLISVGRVPFDPTQVPPTYLHPLGTLAQISYNPPLRRSLLVGGYAAYFTLAHTQSILSCAS